MDAIVTDQLSTVATRVAIVEPGEIIRRGLAEILEGAPNIDLVATMPAIGDAATVADRAPAVILIAAELLSGGGREQLSELLPSARLVQLVWPSGQELGADPPARARRGVHTLPRTAGGGSVLRAVDDAARSLAASPAAGRPGMPGPVAGDVRRGQPTPRSGLTPRQRAVLALIGHGLTNREIAERLGLTEKTVKNYVTAVLAELGVSRRTHAMAYLQAAGEPWPISA